MYYELSSLISEYKQESAFGKWVNTQKQEIKRLAYENRNTIYKKDIEYELSCFSTITNAYNKIKELREKSSVYDVIIKIDKKGYHTFEFKFPISKDVIEEVLEKKQQSIKELGWLGSSCVRGTEILFDTIKDKFENEYAFVDYSNSGLDYKNYMCKIEVYRFTNK